MASSKDKKKTKKPAKSNATVSSSKPTTSYGTNTPGVSTPDRNVVNTSIDQFFPDSAARRSAQAGLNLFDQFNPGPTFIQNPYQANADANIRRGEAMYDASGVTDPGVQTSLNQLNDLVGRSTVVDPNVQTLINEYMSRTGGYTPEEYQMLREQGSQGMNSALQTGLRAARGQAGNAGISGGAAGALGNTAMAKYVLGRGNLERDLAINNINLADTRLQNAGNFVAGRDDEMFRRYASSAQNAFQANYGVMNSNRTDQIEKFKTLAGVVGDATNNALGIAKYNNDSLNAFNQARLAAVTGGGQYGDTRNATNQAIDVQRTAAQNSGGSTSPGSGSVSFPAVNFSNGWDSYSAQTGQTPGGSTGALPSR